MSHEEKRNKIIIRSYPVLIGEILIVNEITLEEEFITSHQREWNVYYDVKEPQNER